jgi:hypothetical protein
MSIKQLAEKFAQSIDRVLSIEEVRKEAESLARGIDGSDDDPYDIDPFTGKLSLPLRAYMWKDGSFHTTPENRKDLSDFT